METLLFLALAIAIIGFLLSVGVFIKLLITNKSELI